MKIQVERPTDLNFLQSIYTEEFKGIINDEAIALLHEILRENVVVDEAYHRSLASKHALVVEKMSAALCEKQLEGCAILNASIDKTLAAAQKISQMAAAHTNSNIEFETLTEAQLFGDAAIPSFKTDTVLLERAQLASASANSALLPKLVQVEEMLKMQKMLKF